MTVRGPEFPTAEHLPGSTMALADFFVLNKTAEAP